MNLQDFMMTTYPILERGFPKVYESLLRDNIEFLSTDFNTFRNAMVRLDKVTSCSFVTAVVIEHDETTLKLNVCWCSAYFDYVPSAFHCDIEWAPYHIAKFLSSHWGMNFIR